MHSDWYERKAILYSAAKIHKNSIMGTRCVYNWTKTIVDMGLDNIVHNEREPSHVRIFNAWIKDCKSDTLRTQDQDNKQRLLQKYKNLRFLDDEYNQTYMIAPENLEFKRLTRRSKHYCVVG